MLEVGQVVERGERPVLAVDVRDGCLEVGLQLVGELGPQVERQLDATPTVRRHEPAQLWIETP